MAKPSSQNKLQLVMGIVLLGVIALAVYWTVVTIWNALSATPTVGAGIAAAALTGALAILSTFLTKHLDRKATVAAQLREKKIPVYEEIIRLVFGIALAGKGGKAPLKEQDIVRQMADITEKLTIWGSDELVEAYYKFRMASIRQAAGGSQDPRQALIALTDLMLAVRRDLGHKNKNISRRKILGLFVNDVPDEPLAEFPRDCGSMRALTLWRTLLSLGCRPCVWFYRTGVTREAETGGFDTRPS